MLRPGPGCWVGRASSGSVPRWICGALAEDVTPEGQVDPALSAEQIVEIGAQGVESSPGHAVGLEQRVHLDHVGTEVVRPQLEGRRQDEWIRVELEADHRHHVVPQGDLEGMVSGEARRVCAGGFVQLGLAQRCDHLGPGRAHPEGPSYSTKLTRTLSPITAICRQTMKTFPRNP